MSKYREIIYSCAFLFCLGAAGSHAAVQKESEVKDTSEPVRRLSDRHNNKADDNVPYRHLHKRQISPRFQSFVQPQLFTRPSFDSADGSIEFNADSPVPSDENNDLFNRRPVFSSQDEEERFFLSRETTTLNPLSFLSTSTMTTTLDPIEQQRLDEQRRFQEEIANKGLREQMQRSFGLRTTSTTTTTTTTPSSDSFLFDELQSDPDSSPFLGPSDSSLENTETLSDSLLELTRPRPAGRFSSNERPPAAQSYSFLRTFRRRRAIDGQQASENEINDLAVSSTASPQQVFMNTLLRDTNPREDLAKIGGWLFENLAKTVERNIAHFAEATVRPRSVHQTPASGFFSSTLRPTLRPFRFLSTAEPPTSYLSQEYHSTPKPVQNFIAGEPTPNALQDYQSTPKPTNDFPSVDEYQSTTPRPIKNIVPVEQLQNYFQEYPSTARPPVKQLFIAPEITPTPLPLAYAAQTTPFNQFQWNVAQGNEQLWRQEQLLANAPKIESVTYATSTTPRAPNMAVPVIMVPQNTLANAAFLPKIRNVQILPVPTPIPEESFSLRPSENTVYRAYDGIYNLGQQTTPRSLESTTIYVQPPASTSTENEASIMALFKGRMNALKEGEVQQQPNQYFDLLPQSNATASPNALDPGSTSTVYSTGSSVTPSSAIFVKMPEEEHPSTAGYIFDRTISGKHKKESSYASKKNNRSPQMLKSTLVYRTPPGKRATLTRSELARNEQMEAGLLAHILEAQGKPLSSWLLGQQGSKVTTTGRPFVSALMNLIRKRSPVH